MAVKEHPQIISNSFSKRPLLPIFVCVVSLIAAFTWKSSLTAISAPFVALSYTVAKALQDGTVSIGSLLQWIPGFEQLQRFMSWYFHLDLTTIAAFHSLGFTKILDNLEDKLPKLWELGYWSSSITVSSKDRLSNDVMTWLGHNVLSHKKHQYMNASLRPPETDQAISQYRSEASKSITTLPIQYTPTIVYTRFRYKGRFFYAERKSVETYNINDTSFEVTIWCLGWSVKPIQEFLEECQQYAFKAGGNQVAICTNQGPYSGWSLPALKPARPMDTVYFDEALKQKLLDDVRRYLDPSTAKFYSQRGIPYRRGYLLYGPPGTGKTSLTVALAGYFNLPLHVLSLPMIQDDSSLKELFDNLPSQCLVLMEDIDAVGMRREEDEEELMGKKKKRRQSRGPNDGPTLAGLLNVLDGAGSQEGRIVLMTSNHPEKLDDALVRPGRIDMQINLAHLKQDSARRMFRRLYSDADVSEERLDELAHGFSVAIPQDKFAPAALQGYLLGYLNAPEDAAQGIETWIADELKKMADLESKRKRLAEIKEKRRQERRKKREARKAARAEETESDLDSTDSSDSWS